MLYIFEDVTKDYLNLEPNSERKKGPKFSTSKLKKDDVINHNMSQELLDAVKDVNTALERFYRKLDLMEQDKNANVANSFS